VQRLGISMTANDIYKANPELNRWDYNTGREVMIPLPRETLDIVQPPSDESPLAVSDPPPMPEVDQGNSYIVINGDTIVKVAMQFGVSLKDLFDVNPGLDSSRLKIGQKIQIPPSQ
jgi:hypothetical protein